MAFPNTPIIDNFNRANEGPPPTGWSALAHTGSLNGIRIVSNEVRDPTGIISNSIWTATQFAQDQECYFTVSVSPGSQSVQLWCRAQNWNVANTVSAYQLSITLAGNLVLWLFKNGSSFILQQFAIPPVVSGDTFGISAIGSAISGYQNGVLKFAVEETTVSGPGNMGFGMQDATGSIVAIDNFGGGNTPVVPLPQAASKMSIKGKR